MKPSSLLLMLCLLQPPAPALALPQQAHGGTPAPAATDSLTAAFVHTAREATRRYQRLDAAIAAGYRPIGPDMPNMGEHWIHPHLAMRRTFDPALPAVLTYLRVQGDPVLTGVAYTAPVRPGESPPALALPEAHWHFHARTVLEEAVGHPAHAMPEGETPGNRLAMLHAWIWVTNPDGLFTPDNWALSFVRRGLSVPEDIPPGAAKALFLLDGGVDYYVRLAASRADLTGQEHEAIRRRLATFRNHVETTLRAAEKIPLEPLDRLWEALWREIRQSVDESLWLQIRALSL